MVRFAKMPFSTVSQIVIQQENLEGRVRKIIGIGWAKTGTMTLGKCLKHWAIIIKAKN
jgi:hypothetical protein